MQTAREVHCPDVSGGRKKVRGEKLLNGFCTAFTGQK